MPELTPDGALAALVRRGVTASEGGLLGVAVSGGGDSVALLLLLDDWRRLGGPALAVVTVDHGLRPEAADEAAGVARLCARLGLPHDTLRWAGGTGRGNVMDAARRARRALIADWAGARGIARVALAHTAEDQAETLLMRLARGSGVDGLAAMAPCHAEAGVLWLRPLLTARRADLRAFLRARGEGWVEDPTNSDPAHDRTRARAALQPDAGLGLTVERLAATADRLALARAALDELADRTARAAARIESGEVLFDPEALAAAPRETQLRLLARAMLWVTGAPYRPRFAALQAALEAPRRATLAGTLVTRRKAVLRIGREPRACGGPVAPGEVWDGRWIVTGPDPTARIGALGAAGLAALADWRAAGLPRDTLLAAPGVWRDGRLIAAPLARPEADWRAIPARDPLSFFCGTIAH